MPGFCRRYLRNAPPKKIPARVRCGFATYFSRGRFEDHWICEYWIVRENRWARADAQLDDVHCKLFGIDFNSLDLPVGAFVTAKEAWGLIRNHGVSSDLFGHGGAVGGWFVGVNLARDYLSLSGQETSSWDGWRRARDCKPEFDASDYACYDKIADCIEGLEQQRQIAPGQPLLTPFWISEVS